MTNIQTSDPLALANRVAESFSGLPEVEAIALGGSASTGHADPGSDIDLYVYATREIPPATRAQIIYPRARRAEVDNRVAEPADEWIEDASGVAVDLMYRHPAWIEEQLDRVLSQYQASVGYSTSFWHNVRYSVLLFDRSGWYNRLQAQADQPYPEALVRAIVAKNHPILRESISSWLNQLEKAVQRDDPVVANQKVAKLLASYFDVLFAVNRSTHPGEKRLLKLAACCEKTPPHLAKQVRALLQAVHLADHQLLLQQANELLDDLDRLLLVEGLLDPR